MKKVSRAERAEALERWAAGVDPDELVRKDTSELRQLADLAAQRESLEDELREAVAAARRAKRSWAEIGTMLGVSKQAAQRKYGRRSAA